MAQGLGDSRDAENLRWPKMCPSRKIREGTVRRVTAGVSATQVRIELVGSIDGLQPLRKEVRQRRAA